MRNTYQIHFKHLFCGYKHTKRQTVGVGRPLQANNWTERKSPCRDRDTQIEERHSLNTIKDKKTNLAGHLSATPSSQQPRDSHSEKSHPGAEINPKSLPAKPYQIIPGSGGKDLRATQLGVADEDAISKWNESY